MTHVRIRVVGLMPNLWWIGESPWPGLPASPDTSFCCCDDEQGMTVASVTYHLPRNPGDPAATIAVRARGREIGEHLAERHGFSLG